MGSAAGAPSSVVPDPVVPDPVVLDPVVPDPVVPEPEADVVVVDVDEPEPEAAPASPSPPPPQPHKSAAMPSPISKFLLAFIFRSRPDLEKSAFTVWQRTGISLVLGRRRL